ncbi:GNAT family N-acetyltransferase [Paenibacillus tianjinensis]|uniref:GNAT family N-acetyltransferase n=1 Tax=Paenibacillus tianjinensis TaxID=2810347 RepID=A0ABX7LG32_9BACL|nr:GNAT family N-acetyltransferase [Paenibacillus tianjinensis]QSF47067.1 GNAT family N-acetyltransferase [Paenibacillus tianjinensis]
MTKMKDFSKAQIDPIHRLEQLCKTYDCSSLRVGLESLKEIDGDEAFLCHTGNQIIGFLSWYTSDGKEANINGMVHPDYRRQGIFRGLLEHAASDMQTQGIETYRFRIPANSEPGMECIRYLGADFATSEFTMMLNRGQVEDSLLLGHSIDLRLEQAADFEFMVSCSTLAFGDSESWSRSYLTRTKGPERITYIAMESMILVGMIRINYLAAGLAVIHDFCVLPAYQGKGLGGEILSAAVKLLLDQKDVRVRLGVITHNRRALNLYQRAGFEISAESHYYVIAAEKF